MNSHDCHHDQAKSSRSKPRIWQVAILMVFVILAFYLLREHSEHLLGYWAYLILLLCPLMHLFHGHSHSRHDADKDSA